MKKRIKKLSLNKETVAVLSGRGLLGVAGGWPTQFCSQWCQPTGFTDCEDTCATWTCSGSCPTYTC